MTHGLGQDSAVPSLSGIFLQFLVYSFYCAKSINPQQYLVTQNNCRTATIRHLKRFEEH